MPTTSISVGDWLKQAVQRLHGISDTPQLDAEILLRAAADIRRAMAYARPEKELAAAQFAALQTLLARREGGEPIAYVVGEQEFWSLPLKVSPAVLIPRPETERLVERALEVIPLEAPARVLDLGTGSGAIALAIAQARPHSQVIAADVSVAALEIAATNLQSLQLQNCKLTRSDWFAAFDGQRFDVIVSNPPYIADDDSDLAPTVKKFEPTMALISGPTGLEAIEHILAQAMQFLNANGRLLFEHGWQQGPRVRALLVQHGYSHVRSHPDLAGHERVTEGRKIETRDA